MTIIQFFRMKPLMAFITVLTTLHIANVSIDPPDNTFGKEDLSLNEIESCVEFALEILLKNTNAIEESDEQDESSGKPRIVHITLFAWDNQLVMDKKGSELTTLHNVIDRNNLFTSLDQPILSPPPKAA